MKIFTRSIGLFLIFGVLFAACSTSKKLAYTPTGTWEYLVIGTPMGDMKGEFVLSKEGDTFSGYFVTNEGQGEMKDLSLEANNLSCHFSTMGYTVKMSGLFEGESFTGKVMAEGYEFPVTAIRK